MMQGMQTIFLTLELFFKRKETEKTLDLVEWAPFVKRQGLVSYFTKFRQDGNKHAPPKQEQHDLIRSRTITRRKEILTPE